MSEKKQAYIAALESLLAYVQLHLAISAAPLAIIATQIATLQEVDSVTFKILVTFNVVLCAFSSAALLIFINVCRSLITKEKLCLHGAPDDGAKLLDYTEAVIFRNRTIDEEFLLKALKQVGRPGLSLLSGPGLLVLGVTLIVAVWL